MRAVLGDVDGDGDLDVVIANTYECATIYLNEDGVLTDSGNCPDIPGDGESFDLGDLALGDVDGDGDLDLVMGRWRRDFLSNDPSPLPNEMYLNENGRFSQTPVWTSSLAAATYSVQLADVDGDGDLDLVCANQNSGNTLYVNTGGTFSAAPVWVSATNYDSRRAELGDIDGDGDLDLACGNFAQPNTLYENIGGTFTTLPVWQSADSSQTWSIALGDMNGDGALDLVSANWNQRNQIHLNRGGTFSTDPQPDWQSAVAFSSRDVALGDVDNDGDLDMVFANLGQVNVAYRNDGNAVFPPAWPRDERAAPQNFTWGIVLGDIDSDGSLDLITTNDLADHALYKNVGAALSGATAWAAQAPHWTAGVALGDLDRDGDADLVFGNDGVWLHRTSEANVIYTNLGSAIEPSATWTSPATLNTRDVCLGDINGDGWLDVVCGNAGQSNTVYLNQGQSLPRMTLAWASGPQNDTWSVALGDVDNDGDLDLVCGNKGSNTLYLNHDGTLSTQPDWVSEDPSSTFSVLLEDVDNDGDLDLACGTAFGSNLVYLNVDGRFAEPPAWKSTDAANTWGMAFGDVNGDGFRDLVCANFGQNATIYFHADGAGSVPLASSPTLFGESEEATSVTLGDMDGDGDLDIILSTDTGGTNLFLNRGDGTWGDERDWSSFDHWGGAPFAADAALTDLDADGDLDVVSANFSWENRV